WGEKCHPVSAFRSGLVRGKVFGVADVGDRELPLMGRADVAKRHRSKPLRRLEDASDELGALDVAREPVQVVGGAGEHDSALRSRSLSPRARRGSAGAVRGAPHVSSTHVSLVPPPWLELTTSEPPFPATPVS